MIKRIQPTRLLLILGTAGTILGWGWHQDWPERIWRMGHSLASQSIPRSASQPAGQSLLGGRYYDVSIPPTKLDKYQSADYRLWIPADVRTLRGIIVKQHGCGDPAAATGLHHAEDLQWQALAQKHQFALLGTRLLADDQPCESWALINYGSGPAFLQALAALAERSQHPELETAPWVLWGHSGGADWVSQILQEYPDRTIAMVGVRGGGFLLLGQNPRLAKIPVLFAAGAVDPYAAETLDLPQQVFQRYRQENAPWTFAIEANTGHEVGDTRGLAIPYLDAILSTRLPTHNPSQPLRPVDPQLGWLGDPSTHAITPANRYSGNPQTAVWLPDQTTARKWQEYSTAGKISPTRKPTAPTNLQAEVSATQARLTWTYRPDPENGLPAFRVYRNNSPIFMLPGQAHDNGDAPSPPQITLEFTDREASPDAVYRVAAYNALGESLSQVAQNVQDSAGQPSRRASLEQPEPGNPSASRPQALLGELLRVKTPTGRMLERRTKYDSVFAEISLRSQGKEQGTSNSDCAVSVHLGAGGVWNRDDWAIHSAGHQS